MTTRIEWTEATWNPTSGCNKVSPGCANCYALTMAARLKEMGQAKYQRDGDPRTSGPGFGLTLHPDTLNVPRKRKKPTTYFVNSMSDLFHPDVPDTFIGGVWDTMAVTPQHTYQILTKRPQRMSHYLSVMYAARVWRRHDYLWCGPVELPLPNVWLGTSIESDRYVFRADHLRETPAAVRFLSLEPLLGPLPSLDLTGIDWVITDCESGGGARPAHPDWYRDIRDRCVAAGIPYFHKQNGAWVEARRGLYAYRGEPEIWLERDGSSRPASEAQPSPTSCRMARVGKKVGGRLLDGRTWDEMPERAGAPA